MKCGRLRTALHSCQTRSGYTVKQEIVSFQERMVSCLTFGVLQVPSDHTNQHSRGTLGIKT